MASLRRLTSSFILPSLKRDTPSIVPFSTLASSTGYQSIGSFHSENIEDLMTAKDYQPPALPFETLPIVPSPDPSLDFLIDRTQFTFLNHGAFGGALKCAYDRAEQWRYYLERQPLRYFDRDLLPHLAYANLRLADFCGVNPEGMVLVQNATTALNAVISGYVREYRKEAKVVVWDFTYGSVKKMAEVYCEKVVEVPFQDRYLDLLWEGEESGHPPERAFLLALDEALSKHPHESWQNALLVLDHVTSNTAIRLPIEAIAKHAKKHHGMIVLVDGAHGLLAQNTQLTQIAPSVDIYISNAHKWLSCPRGVAMMYCPDPHLRDTVLKRPAVVSHGIHDGYLSRFLWDGCRDYAAQLSLPVALEYWDRTGAERARRSMKEGLAEGVALLAEMWHPMCEERPKAVTLAPMSMHSPMALVRLPRPLCGDGKRPTTSAHAKQLQDYLYHCKVEVPIKCINGVLYVRVSCHVYNERKDFEILARVVKEYPL